MLDFIWYLQVPNLASILQTKHVFNRQNLYFKTKLKARVHMHIYAHSNNTKFGTHRIILNANPIY